MPFGEATKLGDEPRVVVDANVLAAALIRPGGWTATELRRDDVRWFAPALLLEELRDHEAEFVARAGMPRDAWDHVVHAIFDGIAVVPTRELAAHRDADRVRRASEVDPDDAPYLACASAVDAELLWTRDLALLQAFPGFAVSGLPG